jgi:hypothetical protein
VPAADPEATLPGRQRSECANCGAPLRDRYCAWCGQRDRPHRITLRGELGGFAKEVFDLDRGLLHTFLGLCRRPARVVRDYLRGRTVAYTHPGKYFLLALAVLQLAAYLTGAVGDFSSGLTEESELLTASQVTSAIDRFFVFLAGPAVILLAWLQRRVFGGAGLHYGEHLVFALYVTAQQALIWTVALIASHLLRGPFPHLPVVIAFAATGGYYLWSVQRLLGGRLLTNAARVLLILTLTPLLYTLLATVLAMVITA